MKIPSLFVSCIALLMGSAARSMADDAPPTMRETKEWIILSGTGFERKGPLPWTYALRKDTILSVSIRPDPASLYPENSEPKQYHQATPEEIQKLPAVIHVTTTELIARSASEAKQYNITGLTNATAPAMLRKILDAIELPASEPDAK